MAHIAHGSKCFSTPVQARQQLGQKNPLIALLTLRMTRNENDDVFMVVPLRKFQSHAEKFAYWVAGSLIVLGVGGNLNIIRGNCPRRLGSVPFSCMQSLNASENDRTKLINLRKKAHYGIKGRTCVRRCWDLARNPPIEITILFIQLFKVAERKFCK